MLLVFILAVGSALLISTTCSLFEAILLSLSPPQVEMLAETHPRQAESLRKFKENIEQPITAILTRAPGNDAPIGGLKVTTENGWFAARPSGTENVYKIYAESFLGAEHLAQIQESAREVVSAALQG